MTGKHTPTSWTIAATTVWTLLGAGFLAGSLALSLCGELNRTGCTILLVTGLAGALYGYTRLIRSPFAPRGIRIRRFRRLFPLMYLLCASAAIIGGAIHAPTNYDALCYRVPRLLHWLSAESWHWIPSADPRMNFSAVGFEAMMLPAFAALHTLRFAFLINVIYFLLFPGLLFLMLSGLGVRKNIAARWMWILPSASCFVMQAGSIGNDLPACIHVLAGIVFALRAARSGKASDAMLAVLSAAMMTGMKASNLPLLLPIAICLAAAFRNHMRLLVPAAAAAILSLPVSFLPIAIANVRHAGHWSGDPGNPLVLQAPLAGIAGNTILLGSAALIPAVFPPAEKVNAAFNTMTAQPPLDWIKSGFMDFRMTHPQMASEENSGLGLGVSAAVLLALAGSLCGLRGRRLIGLGGLVCAGFWFALFFYMSKLGNCGAPRLIAPYYAGLLLMPLLLIGSTRVFRRRWWVTAVFLAMLPVFPALACNPARPLLPMSAITRFLIEKQFAVRLMSRMETVYHSYSIRADACAPVRELLPADAKVIGFAGTSGEPQYSFWLPMGERKVVDFLPGPGRKPPGTTGLDVIVTSRWGCMDRFGMTPEQLAGQLGWRISGKAAVRMLASAEDSQWSVLLPVDR
jgi:hypothetical protein